STTTASTITATNPPTVAVRAPIAHPGRVWSPYQAVSAVRSSDSGPHASRTRRTTVAATITGRTVVPVSPDYLRPRMPTLAELVERLVPVTDLAADWDPVGFRIGD